MRVAVQLALSTVAIAPVESPDLTRVPPDASIVDSLGALWTIEPNDRIAMRDGVGQGWGTIHVLKYVSRRVWFLDSGAWHQLSLDGARIEQSQGTEPGSGDPPPPPPPPPPPENRAPTWNMADIIFEQGVPAVIDIRTRATDLDGDAMTFNVETALRADLVGPFSFNDFNLFYDGRDMGLAEDAPPLLLDSGITISADDGR